MKILYRYLAVQLLKGYLVVLAVLLVLFSFLNLLEQLEDVGQGSFALADAFLYVVMTLPRRAVDLAPTTALLGTLIGLASLGRFGELTAVRAAGVSAAGMAKAVLLPAVAFLAATFLVSELIAPVLYQSAEQWRARAVSAVSTGDRLPGKGFWARGEGEYINVRTMLSGQVPADIDVYQFTPDGVMTSYMSAKRAEVQRDGSWKLYEVVQKQLEGSLLKTENIASVRWEPFWDQAPFQLSQLPLEGLSAVDLSAYLRYLQEVNQESPEVELLFWRRLVEPGSILVMAMLALSFSFGSVRSSSFARQLVLGAITGVGFFLVTQIFYTMGLSMKLPAVLVALVPFLGVALISLAAYRRVTH